MNHSTPTPEPSPLWRLAVVLSITIWVGSVHVAADVNVDVANVTASSGSTVPVPVDISNLSPEEIVSIEAFVTFDPAKVSYNNLSATGMLLESWATGSSGLLYSTVSSGPVLDTLKIAGAGLDTLETDGVLFNINFDVGMFYSSMTAALKLEHLLLNAGVPGATPGDGSIKLVGVDGSIEVQPGTMLALADLSATITDANENRTASVDQVPVRVSVNGQNESFDATETTTSSGVFTGTISTAFAMGSTPSGDGTVQLSVGDQVSLCFDDSLDASGNSVERCASSIFTGGTLGVVDATVVAGPTDTILVQLVDPDLNESITLAESVNISVRNDLSAETETIQLNETGVDTDTFAGRVFTVFGSGTTASGDSTIRVEKSDLLLVDYLDAADGTGAASSRLDTCTIIDPWGDASGNGSLRGFDAAEILAHAVGAAMLTGLDSLAANLDSEAPFGSITAFDASLVLQRRVGLIDRFPVQPLSSANHPPHLSGGPKRPVVNRRLALISSEGFWTVSLDDRSEIISGELLLTGFNGRVEMAPEAGGFLVSWRRQGEGMRIALAGSRPLQGSGELLRLYPQTSSSAEVLLSRATFNDGRIVGVVEVGSSGPGPRSFQLLPNVPNPFNPETVIGYALPRASEVQLEVFDALGRSVRILVPQRVQPVGTHRVRWDGRDGRGASVASGIYFYRLKTPEFQAMQKMILVK